jgi:hypothetical protein
MNWKEKVNKFWSNFRQIFEDSSGYLSSKRVFGSIGFLTGLYLGYKAINPEVVKIVLVISAAMLGLDSITDIWKSKEQPSQNLSKIKEDEIDK